MNAPRSGSGARGGQDSTRRRVRNNTGEDSREISQRLPIDPGRIARPLLDPIEAALREFTEALDNALDEARAEIEALKADNEALRGRLEAMETAHAAHTHHYVQGNPGDLGVMWWDLRKIRSFLDGDLPNNESWADYGVYLRGAAAQPGQERPETDPPSDDG